MENHPRTTISKRMMEDEARRERSLRHRRTWICQYNQSPKRNLTIPLLKPSIMFLLQYLIKFHIWFVITQGNFAREEDGDFFEVDRRKTSEIRGSGILIYWDNREDWVSVDHYCESGKDGALQGTRVSNWGCVGCGYSYVVVESEMVTRRGELLECSWWLLARLKRGAWQTEGAVP